MAKQTLTYSEKLKDPRWQKKRLLILSRDNFQCTLCKDDKSTLHVHHEKYNGQPWEAKDEHLKTVCEHCHSFIEWMKKTDNWVLEFITRIVKCEFDSIAVILLDGVYLYRYNNKTKTFSECSGLCEYDFLQVAELIKQQNENG